jgi:ribose-phosphate pyrophosphokinase
MNVLNLDPKFQPTNRKYDILLEGELFKFSGGEVHVKIKPTEGFQEEFLITHRINSSDNLMEVLLAADALRRKWQDDIPISLFIPYIPYGRQDRPMIEGEPFSLKVFAEILKIGRFFKVLTIDPHSDVTPALIDNLKILPQTFLKDAKKDIEKNFGEFVLVSPDGGALKKIYKQAQYIDYKGEIICANKNRDVSTGKILNTEINTQQGYGLNPDLTYWIQDDICDGGRTFIELAKLLRQFGAKHVVLSVSHGIFSKGEEELKKHLDKIYTTVSIKSEESDLIRRFLI